MKEIVNKIFLKLKFLIHFWKSKFIGWLIRSRFSNIHAFALFIGYPRSGHSLIGALLDAHPNVIMGMEWGVISHVLAGYRRKQVYYSLIQNSKAFKEKRESIWTGYSYRVSELYQGSSTKIEVIGDKFGSIVAKHLHEDPMLLSLLRRTIKDPIHFIHVVRNPFDVITTMTTRFFEKNGTHRQIEDMDLMPNIYKFYKRASTVNKLKHENDFMCFDLHHERFIDSPKGMLAELMKFLKLPVDSNYLSKCAKIVYIETHKSRYNVPWSKELISIVENENKKYKFLHHYTFDV